MAGKKKRGSKAKGKKQPTGSPKSPGAGVSAPVEEEAVSPEAEDLATGEQGVAPTAANVDVSTSNASDVAMPESTGVQPVGAVPETAAREEIVEEEEGQERPAPETKPEPTQEGAVPTAPEETAPQQPPPSAAEEATPSEVPPVAEGAPTTKVAENISPAGVAARKAAQMEQPKTPFVAPASTGAEVAAAEAAAMPPYFLTAEPRSSMAWAPVETARPPAAVTMAPAPQQPSPAQRQTQAIAESDAQNGPGAPAVASNNSAQNDDSRELERESHQQSQPELWSTAHFQSSKEPRGRQPFSNNQPLPTNAAPVSPAQVPSPPSHTQQATATREEPLPESIPPPYSAYPVSGDLPSSESESQDLSDLPPDSSNKSPHGRENIELSNLDPNGKDTGSLQPEPPALAKTTEGGVKPQIPFLGFNGKGRANSQEPKMPTHPIITKKRLNISDEQLVGARPSVVTGVPSGTDFSAIAAAETTGKVPPYYTAETEGIDNVRLEYGIDQDASRRRFASLSTPAPLSMRVKNRLNACIQHFKERRTSTIILIVAGIIVVLGLVIGLGVGLTLRR